MQKELLLFQKLAEKLIKAEKEQPIATPIPPEELFTILPLALEDQPVEDAFFEEALEKLVLSTPRTATRLFFNQLFGGRNPKACTPTK
jgi:predicted Zn-dependent peptidase